MNLKSSLLMAAMAIGCVMCSEKDGFNLFGDSIKSQAHEIDGQKAIKLMGEARSNQKVYDILNLTPVYEKIQGEFAVLHFLKMAVLKPDTCREDIVERRRSSCQDISIPSLKEYCDFCLGKQTEYCERIGSMGMLSYMWAFNWNVENIKANLKEVTNLSKRIDDFITSSGGNSQDEEKNVVEFCKNAGRPEKDSEYCHKFVEELLPELSQYAKDSEESVKFLEEKGGLPLAVPLARCNIVLAEC